MSLTITTAQAAILSAAGTENYPFFAWENLSSTMLTESGTEDADGAATNAITGSTYDYWVGVPATDEVALRTNLAAAAPADFLAVAAHNLADIGAGIVPQTSGTSRTNLMIRSQDFSASWVASAGTLTANVVDGPDGSTSGARLVEDGTSAQHYVANSSAISFTSGTSYTVSIFVRRSVGSRHMGIALPSSVFGATVSVAFNLTTPTATIEVSGTSTTAGIEAYASSTSGATWYRCWVKSQATATTSSSSITFLMSNSTTDGNPTYTGDSTSALIFWGAQVEAGSLTSYVRTTTTSAASVWYDWSPWVIPANGDVIAWHFAEVSAATWRVLIRGVSSSVKPAIGVFFVGKVLQMARPFYQGFTPILTPTEVELQSNISAGGHLLGSAVTKRGSRIGMQFANLPDTFIRGDEWLAFQTHFNEGGGAFVAWRPTKYADDVHYFWRDGATLQPTNSGPRGLMSVAIEGRVYEG